MEDQNDFIIMMNKIENDSKEKFRRNLKIINCLNELEEIINKDFCSPLLITEKDKFIVNNLVKNKIAYIKDSLLNEKNILAKICLKIFEYLFVNKNSLNYNDLDEKVIAFKLVLNTLQGKPKKDANKKYINKVIKNKETWKKVINMPFAKFADVGIIIAVVLNFSETIENIIEILIELLREKHENDFNVLFDIKKVKDSDFAKK